MRVASLRVFGARLRIGVLVDRIRLRAAVSWSIASATVLPLGDGSEGCVPLRLGDDGRASNGHDPICPASSSLDPGAGSAR